MAIGNLQQIIPAFFTGPNGRPLTPDQIAQRQEVAKSLLQQASDTSPNAGGWASVLAKGLQGGIAGYQQGRADDAAALNAKNDQANIEAGLASIFGGGIAPVGGVGGAFPSAVAQGASPTSGVATGTIPSNFNIGANDDAIRQGIIETAKAIGADPVDLATAISYETGGTFNPTKAGPTTQWGQHRGLIQFGEPQAKQYGVDWNDPIGSQLGANGAIANYFRSSGFKPGMSGLDLYSTINAGAPGRYSASDANNGGAPGNVADKWNNQMRDHRAKALALLGVDSKDVTGAMLNGQQAIQAIAPIEQGANPYPEAGQVAPHDFTGNPQLSAAAGVPMQGIPSEQFDAIFNGQASAPMAMAPDTQAPQQPQIDPRLASINDQMLGGALSPTGRSEVAQALTGYFPDAPSANRAPITAQNNAMSQSPMQQSTGGVNPQVIASLLGPNSSPQARHVGSLLLGHHQQQQAAIQAQQQAQRELAQRQQVAASMGIDPSAAMDTEAWKAAVAKANRDRSTVTVGNTVLDANTMQPIYEGRQAPTANMQEYEAYAADERAAGRQPLRRFDYTRDIKKSGANNISNVVGGESLSPGQKKIDENFADTYLAWNQGGFADSRKLIEQLGESLQILESGENVTGKIGLLPDVVRPFLNENGAIARENVEEVVQRSLREILGAQFTEKEGERLIARAFNPLLPPKENAKRVRRLLKTIGSMADAKQDMVDYFDNEGTLRGYKGSRPTTTELNALASGWEKVEDEENSSSGSKTKTGVTWSVN